MGASNLDSDEIRLPVRRSGPMSLATRSVRTLRSRGTRLKEGLAGGALLLVLSSIGVNASNSLFHIAVSRLIGPAAYGALGALLNVTAVLSVPLGGVQATIAMAVAKRIGPESGLPLRQLMARTSVIGLAAMAVFIAALPLVDAYLHLRSPVAGVFVGVWLLASVQGAALQGVLLGYRRFSTYGIGLLLGTGVIRLAAGVALGAAGMGVAGAMLATTVGTAAMGLHYAWSLRSSLWVRGRFLPSFGDTALSLAALSGAALLGSVDAWLARHFLSVHGAGLFAAAATAGRMALFLPAMVILVYFPRIAESGGRGRGARAALVQSTSLVAVLGLGTAGAMAALAHPGVTLLFGAAYGGASAAVGTVALADALIAMASCLVYYEIAGRRWAALAPWPACALAFVLAELFHKNVEAIALDMLASSCALLVVLATIVVVAEIQSRVSPVAAGRTAPTVGNPRVPL